MKSVRILLLGTAFVLASCVPKPPAPPPPAQQAPPPPPMRPAPPPAPADWRDLPLTPGAWFYREGSTGSEAIFGPRESERAFSVSCDKARRAIVLARSGTTSGNTMTVQATSGVRNLPLSIESAGTGVYVAVPAGDAFLDAMVFSRGRFTVEVPGIAMLVLPAWPEPARVIEDCRS